VPGDVRSGAEQGIAAGTLLGSCWFGLVDLMVVLAGQTRSKIGREELKIDLLTTKLRCLNNVKLLRALTANQVLGTIHCMPLQLLLSLKLYLHFPQ